MLLLFRTSYVSIVLGNLRTLARTLSGRSQDSASTTTVSSRSRRHRASSGAPSTPRSTRPTRPGRRSSTQAPRTGSSARAASTSTESSPSPARGTSRPGMRTWSSRPWPRKASRRRTAGTAARSWTSRCRATGADRGRRWFLPQHRLRAAEQHLRWPAGVDPRGRPGPVAQGRLHRVPALPVSRSNPARWGDYSWAIFVPFSGGKIDFATNYIQYPNCTGSAFTLTLATCGGTRDGMANWGTSVSYVVP